MPALRSVDLDFFGGEFVVLLALSRSGRARLRPLRIAARNNREAMVETGLTAGDNVVVYPGDNVRDGVMVKTRTRDGGHP